MGGWSRGHNGKEGKAVMEQRSTPLSESETAALDGSGVGGLPWCLSW